MKSVAIVDTSVFLNILDVPTRNQDRNKVLSDFEALIHEGTSFLLPIAAIYETGNHIAQLKRDGNLRRNCADRFATQVRQAIAGEAPWTVIEVPQKSEIQKWLRDFPDSAMRGVSMGDLSIIKQLEYVRKRTPNHKVWVWAIDGDLLAYGRES